MAVLKNFGSGLALGVGVLGILAGLAALGRNDPKGIASFIFGLDCLIGALIYRSAKKRKLADKPSSWFRLFGEGVGVLIILFFWLSVANLKELAVKDPLPFLIGPIWALAAYAFANFRDYEKYQEGEE
jgi:hypothetical protein